MSNKVSNKKTFVQIALLFLVAGCGPMQKPEIAATDLRALHDSLLVLDSHVDIPFDFATAAADPAVDGPLQVDLPKMRAGGVDAAFFIVYIGQGPLTEQGYAQAYRGAVTKFDAIERMTLQHADQIGLARTVAQARELFAVAKKSR